MTASRDRASWPRTAGWPNLVWFVQGNRIMVRKKLTQRVLAENLSLGSWSVLTWWTHRLRRNVSRVSPMITLPLGPLRKRVEQTGERALGCNQSMWRKDLERIGGFDAVYVGWGWEDSDILARLLHTGVRRKYGHYATGVIHLHHEALSRGRTGCCLTKLSRSLA